MDPDNDRWVSSDEARTKFRDLMDEVAHHEAHVHVLRYGKPVAVIVPTEWYEEMRAKLAPSGPETPEEKS